MANQLTVKNTLLFSTAGVPAATDNITTSSDVLALPTAKTIEYKNIGNGAIGNNKTETVTDLTTTDFTAEVIARTGGALGTVPHYAELLKSCGLSETINLDATTALPTDVTYAPATTFVSGTAQAYLDGSYRDITGIVGDITFGGKVGELAKFSFAMKGFTSLGELVGANPTVTVDINKNLKVENASVITVGGTAIPLTSFEFKTGNVINETNAVGQNEYYISDIKPTIKVTAVKTKGVAAHWDDLNANTIKTVVVTLGTVAGDKITLTAPYCNPTNASENDDSGKIIYDETFECQSSAGYDNFSIVYA